MILASTHGILYGSDVLKPGDMGWDKSRIELPTIHCSRHPQKHSDPTPFTKDTLANVFSMFFPHLAVQRGRLNKIQVASELHHTNLQIILNHVFTQTHPASVCLFFDYDRIKAEGISIVVNSKEHKASMEPWTWWTTTTPGWSFIMFYWKIMTIDEPLTRWWQLFF